MIILGRRQVGKSTRLLKDCIEYVKESKSAAHIVVHKSKLIEAFTNKLKAEKLEIYSSISIGTRMKRGTVNFVDEFDFISPDRLFIDTNSNYYSTLRGKFLFSEFFQKLANAEAREHLPHEQQYEE